MNALFMTQGLSIRFFYDLMVALRPGLKLGKVGFYVSDSYSYDEFLKEHPTFEKECVVVKEWELVRKAKQASLDFEALDQWEKKLGVPSLWPALVADRRLTSGKLSTLHQDYSPRFDHDTLLKILKETLTGVDSLFEAVQPQAVFSFICVSTGEYVSSLIAKSRGVRIFNLRPTRIANNMHWAGGIFEPSEEIARVYAKGNIGESWEKAAQAYIDQAQSKHALYEGVIKPSRKPHRVRQPLSTLGGRLTRALVRQVRYALFNGQDHHNPGFFTTAFYKKIVNPITARKVDRALTDAYVTADKLAGLKYAFFPLHTEPEVSLLVYSPANVNQVEAVRRVAGNLPIGMKMLVKEHPASIGKRPVSFYKKLLAIPNVLLVDPALDARTLISHSSLVVVIVGSVGLEALLLKKPVFALGKSPFDFLPETMIRRQRDPLEMGKEIQWLLDNYSYQPDAMLRFVASILKTSVPIDFYSILLKKKGVFSVAGGDVDSKTIYNKEISTLAQHTVAKIAETKQVFVFDWDGTLFDSMAIKAEVFSRTLASTLSRPQEEIKRLYLEFSGRPRKEIVKKIFETFKMDFASFEYEAFNATLTEQLKIHLSQANLFNEATMILEELLGKQKQVFISSSVPQKELEHFVSKKISEPLLSRFSGVLGSSDNFGKGPDHIKFIENKTSLSKDKFIFIGDDLADYELSRAAGVEFVMVDRHGRKKQAAYAVMEDLSSLRSSL